jgi:hypothetical protein
VKRKKEHTPWWLATAFMMGLLLFVGSFVWADEAVDVPYEVQSERDTLVCGDSIIIIHTVCAPICSSRARIINKEGQEIGVLQPPFKSAFPEAYIENGKVLWRDNDTFDYSPVP